MRLASLLVLLLCTSYKVSARGVTLDEKITFGRQVFNERCATCHGFVGRYSAAPNLWGQQKEFLEKSIIRFQKNERKDLLMNGLMNQMARLMSNEQIEAVSEYLSRENPCAHNGQPTTLGGDVSRGRQLVERNYCTACHTGKADTFGPNIMGQKEAYVLASIEAFKSQKRDNPNMYGLVQHFDRNIIIDIAAYLASVSECKN